MTPSRWRKFRKATTLSGPDLAVRQVLLRLSQLGLNPGHIVDIGANHGNWSRTALSVFPQARMSLFEPQKRLAPFLKDLAERPDVVIHYKGCGAFDGAAPFTFHDRDDSCSFVYAAEQAQQRGFSQSQIDICRLDTALTGGPFGPAKIVKIDAEGLDLEVLEGATETLRGTEVVLAEASVANPDYPNSVSSVVQKMHSLGFRLFDVTDLNRTPQRQLLWLVEAAFIRVGSAIDTAGSQYK